MLKFNSSRFMNKYILNQMTNFDINMIHKN